MTEILIKRLSKEVTLPKYETDGSSGLDLAAFIDKNIEIKPGKSKIIPTGLAVAIPKNKKSFIANKIAQILLNKLIDDRNIN